MSIEVPKKMVDVLRRSRIPIPFSNIECEKSFIGVLLRLFDKLSQVGSEICDKILIKILPKEMCYRV